MFLVCALLLAGCETEGKKKASDHPYHGASFTIRVPEGVRVALEQGDGYAVHYFRLGETGAMMGIYEGQRPHLFSNKEKDLTVMRQGVTQKTNVVHGDDAWGVDSSGHVWRESVWTCTRVVRTEKKLIDLPSMVHIWYFGVSEEQQTAFDAIVETLEIQNEK